MLFNSGTNSIVDEIDLLCDSDSTSYPIAAKTRRVNYSLEELIGEIIAQDGTWQFDDTNHTDLPRGTATLVEGQEDYSFTNTFLAIEAVEVLNTNNVFRRLKPIDHKDLNGLSPQEFFGVDSSGDPTKGIPEFYDIVGNNIFLYPTPTSTSVTLASGLRIWFQRTVDLFTTSDTTQAPGIPSPYHSILAFMAAIPYCMTYKKDRVAGYERKVVAMRKDLIKFYGKRDKFRRKVMTPKQIRYI